MFIRTEPRFTVLSRTMGGEMKRLTIFDESKKDISDDVKLVNKKSNPFGWSSADIEFQGKIIGFHESGGVVMREPYSYTITDDGASDC